MDSIIETTWIIYSLAGLAGYLVGSISFARLLNRILSRGTGKDKLIWEIPGSDMPFETDIYTATGVGTHHGKAYGCATSVLDMIKVAIPTYVVLRLFPDQPFYLVTALLGIVGNNYPLFNKFKGGGGFSAIIGALIVINWFGIFIANIAAMIIGYFFGSVLFMRLAGNFLCIFWFWIYFNDIYHVGFMILANVVFLLSISRDLNRFTTMIKQSTEEVNQEYMSKTLLMGGGFGRFIDRYGFPALLRKLFSNRSES